MTIDLDEGAERDDLALPHLLTPTKRLHIIAEILAVGIRRVALLSYWCHHSRPPSPSSFSAPFAAQ